VLLSKEDYETRDRLTELLNPVNLTDVEKDQVYRLLIGLVRIQSRQDAKVQQQLIKIITESF